MSYQKVGEFTLNRTKEKRNDRSPDMYGRLIVNEPLEPGEYSLAGWTKESQHGKFLSGAVSVKAEQTQQPAQQQAEQNQQPQTPDPVPEGDGVPF